MIQQSRRSFISGIGAIIAAPAIVRASSLMPIKALDDGTWRHKSQAEIMADIERLIEQINLGLDTASLHWLREISPLHRITQ